MSDLTKYINKRKEIYSEFQDNFDEGYENFKIGAMLKQARIESGITQEQIANKMHTKKITKLAYTKLKEEYEDKIKEYETGINNKQEFEKKFRKKLILRKKELSESTEIFKGKLEIGEMSSEDFESKKEKIKKDIENVELVVKLLK